MFVDRGTWSQRHVFSRSGHDNNVCLVAWSRNGAYLASSRWGCVLTHFASFTKF
jgi:hypothetical protein